MFGKIKKKWDSFWESEARKLDSALFNIVAEKTREENKEQCDKQYWKKYVKHEG